MEKIFKIKPGPALAFGGDSNLEPPAVPFIFAKPLPKKQKVFSESAVSPTQQVLQTPSVQAPTRGLVIKPMVFNFKSLEITTKPLALKRQQVDHPNEDIDDGNDEMKSKQTKTVDIQDHQAAIPPIAEQLTLLQEGSVEEDDEKSKQTTIDQRSRIQSLEERIEQCRSKVLSQALAVQDLAIRSASLECEILLCNSRFQQFNI